VDAEESMAKSPTVDAPLGAAAESGDSIAQQVRTSFAMPNAPVLVARDLRFGPMAVFELRYDGFEYGQSDPVPSQDALLVTMQLRPSAHHRITEDGSLLPEVALDVGMSSVHDLRGGLIARSVEPFHSVNFIVPLGDMVEAQEEHLRPTALRRDSRLAIKDPVFEALGRAMIPALAQPERAVRLFVDNVLFAMRSHVATSFGLRQQQAAPGGLAPWQERRAKAMIEARLAHNLSLAEVARECELSVSQFARAFKRTTGMPPHHFLLERRLDRARELLLHSEQPLAAVADACGFADQSHFTRLFHKAQGQSPGAFRAAAKSTRATRP
jgi:AraC-like DNA-binding protein